jgi:hypothetical protein
MPLIIDKFHAVFCLVGRVADIIVAFVGFRVLNPSGSLFNMRWEIIDTAGDDCFPSVHGEVLEEEIPASHSCPFSCLCGGVCTLSAEWVLSGAAADYSEE